MPAFTDSHPRHPRKVHGVIVAMPHVYAEGHVLTSPEARFLSNAVIDRVTNSYGSRLTDTAKAHNKGTKKGEHITAASLVSEADLLDAFSQYAVGLNQRSVGTGEPVDPVEAKARKIAQEAVQGIFKREGHNFRAMSRTYAIRTDDADGKPHYTSATKDTEGAKSMYTHHTDRYLEKNPWVHEQAKTQLAAMEQHTSGSSLDTEGMEGIDTTEQDEAA